MIRLGDPEQPLDRALLRSEGGFAWWYVDLVDDSGNGVVCIWAFGLPFLPGYRSGVRRGHPEAAGDRPSLNLVVYESGVPAYYLLQEYEPSDCSWQPECEVSTMGRSRLESRTVDGRRLLRIDLDLDSPGQGRLRGTIEVDGSALHYAPGTGAAEHDWTPLATACRGSASLELEGRSIAEVTGRAYHDRNGSAQPLDQLGIDHWIWGRMPVGEDERIYYLLWPEDGGDPVAWGLDVAADGSVEGPIRLDIELSRAAWTRYLVRTYGQITLRDPETGATWLTVDNEVMDNSPFYLRYRTRSGDAWGVGELVLPHRVDLWWQRIFIRMSVVHADVGHHFLSPWFVGERVGRLRRLLGLDRPRIPETEPVPERSPNA